MNAKNLFSLIIVKADIYTLLLHLLKPSDYSGNKNPPPMPLRH